MFIRRTHTRRTEDGQPYFSHRLVHSERIGNAVRQRTLLNLGRHFDVPQAQWPLLCARIDDILAGQTPLVADCPTAVEHEAQRIAAQLVARSTPVKGPAVGPTDVQPVDVDSLRLVRPRSVGVEQVGLWALEQVGLPALLAELGVNGALRTAAAGAIVGRLAQPASERATHRWLQQRSGLGELLGVDFETVSSMQLYRASDALVKHREAIEAHLFERSMGLFDLQPTVTLYDLTNTYFEGEAGAPPQAKRGDSQEKSSDTPPLTPGPRVRQGLAPPFLFRGPSLGRGRRPRLAFEIGLGQVVEGDGRLQVEQPHRAVEQMGLDRLAMLHQRVRGAVELHRADGLEVDAEQLP
ncbi:MAG: hypothetical protein OXG04_20280, partial [Acidobacteria bacterium]|nr:hypothetical protein [Acidobacteriota bacterium]